MNTNLCPLKMEDPIFVRSLYNYSYLQDNGENVHMILGETYYLVDTSDTEWWQVQRINEENGHSFYVPSHYVEMCDRIECGMNHVKEGDGSNTLQVESETPEDMTHLNVSIPENTSDDDDALYANLKSPEGDSTMDTALTDSGVSSPSGEINSTAGLIAKITGVDISDAGDYIDQRNGGEYVNLDEYRAAAGMKIEESKEQNRRSSLEHIESIPEESEPDYVNSEDLVTKADPNKQAVPLPGSGEYVKTLLGVWDMYRDPVTNRLYYFQHDSGERTWKPPRDKHDKHTAPSSPTSPKPTLSSAQGDHRVPNIHVIRASHAVDAVVPDGWSTAHDDGEVFFVNEKTKEKWQCSKDNSGQTYFYRLGSVDTYWELPKVGETTTDSRHHVFGQVNGDSSEELNNSPKFEEERPVPKSSPRAQQRFTKAKSMILDIDFSRYQPAAAAMQPKASTLPSNLSAPQSTSPTTEDKTLVSVLPQPISAGTQSDQYAGFLHKAKVMESGKKLKKNWTQSYVKLNKTNIVFYKDQKSSIEKPGQPHGKPDFMFSLSGATLDLIPKEVSGRKYCIKVATNTGVQYLLQADTEIKMHEWHTKMALIANEICPQRPGPNTSGGSDQLDVSDETEQKHNRRKSKKWFSKSSSVDESNLELGKGIRDKLLNLISRRPPLQKLQDKGIIKDNNVFGTDLRHLCDREHTKVPNFVKQCIAAIEKRGLDHDGIFRVSGNLAQIQKLRFAVDKEEMYNLDDEFQWDVHVLTGALKLFFRELKEPLFPFCLFDRFCTAMTRELNSERLKGMKDLVAELPKCNLETMRMLFYHLNKVVDHKDENRMETHNVAIVFGPTLIWPEKEAPSLAASMIYQSRIVEYMLLEYKNIFR